jgi:signal transduction histidine kinase
VQEQITFFAPPERAAERELKASRSKVIGDDLVRGLLNAMPDAVLVLNEQRQVVVANERAALVAGRPDERSLIGERPGELLACEIAQRAPSGCGTAKECAHCGAVVAIMASQRSGKPIEGECRLLCADGPELKPLELAVRVTPLWVGGERLMVMSLRDISAEKRREVLERLSFHDLMNTATGLVGMASLLAGDGEPTKQDHYRARVTALSEQIVNELRAHRDLVAAEDGSLEVKPELVDLVPWLEQMVSLYCYHSVNDGQVVRLEPCSAEVRTVYTDPTLLGRVVGNLLKNAVEASAPTEEVRLAVTSRGRSVRFSVHNVAVMPEEVRCNVFKRFFSTKAKRGRGMGTYSVRLLVERYLGGKVSFVSKEGQGTTFTVTLPLRQPG